MLSYDIKLADSDSLYHFIYKCIKKDILSGALPADEKLPSKRPFATQLGVSVITVENAYAQLLTEGFIYTKPRMGFFVSAIDTSKVPGANAGLNNIASQKQSREAQKSTPDAFNQEPRRAPKKYLADFINNQANPESFPFSTWAKITRKVLCENQNELLVRPPYGGTLAVRKSIAKLLREFRNMNVDPDQIIMGAGTEYLYGLIVQLLGFDKKYGVEDPGYSNISKIYRKMNVVCNFIPMDESGVIVDQLEETCTDVIHISPSHHFPTGIVTPVSRRYELLSWASKSSNRFIVEDDYDSEFRMVGSPIPAMKNIDVMDKVIYINTFSKTLTSSARFSYMVLPKPLAKRFRDEFSFYACTISTLEQLTLSRFIDEGSFEKHINRMRNAYRSRRDVLLQAISKSKLGKLVEIHEENAGLHFIMEVQTTLTDEEFCKRAEEKGVRIGALSDYYTEATPSEHQFIINYSGLSEKILSKALSILYEVAVS
ncbi:PLP-dependent aminotransferase family protein [Fibrobacter sp. UWEL]|uniref:MocR-like pyridoxine biosynthesis transcription factor PdxR n=1 Tax=Fibrobacter sp. UWEL TaxID=1896209 RepID=UPI000911157B|nr:PLP-dependent aminotransferase family protein [Fibrobacter sp. UWEL]SHK82017.1 transcriptional regulator, GntR family [Fibrobacter sp. UWEL]